MIIYWTHNGSINLISIRNTNDYVESGFMVGFEWALTGSNDTVGLACLRGKTFDNGRNCFDKRSIVVHVLSFACAKERTKEKHTGNDVRPLPVALIKL